MKGNHVLEQAFNGGIDSLLEPVSSQTMNCSLSHFRVGFKRETGRLPLGWYSVLWIVTHFIWIS